MPRLNRRGEWCAGVAGIPASWGTASGTGTLIPGGLAPDWVTDDVLIVHDCTAACVLKTTNVRTGVSKPVAPRGANTLAAGGGVWAAWLEGVGLYTSSGLSLPDASLSTVGPDGAIAVKRQYQSFGPWDVHETDGLVWLLTAGTAVYVQLLGAYRAVWTEDGEPRTAGACPVPNPMTRPYYGLTMSPPPHAADVDGWWVLYADASDRLVLHPVTSTAGYVLAPPGSLTYRPALRRLTATTMRVVWSTTEGEATADIVVATVDLTAARTGLGTAVPPIWTEPTGPPVRPPAIGHDDVQGLAYGLYPPYPQPIVDRATLQVTTPWQRFFLTLASGRAVEALAAAQARAPVGELPLTALQPIDSPRLLGRGTPGAGPVEQLTIGAGLALVGLELSVTSDLSTLGYWTPITNGDPVSPEILFDAAGDCVVGFVPTPGAA